MSAERGWISDPQPSAQWRDSHYSRQADRVNAGEAEPAPDPHPGLHRGMGDLDSQGI